MIPYFPTNIIVVLTSISNSVFKFSYFVKLWKNGDITMIPRYSFLQCTIILLTPKNNHICDRINKTILDNSDTCWNNREGQGTELYFLRILEGIKGEFQKTEVEEINYLMSKVISTGYGGRKIKINALPCFCFVNGSTFHAGSVTNVSRCNR